MVKYYGNEPEGQKRYTPAVCTGAEKIIGLDEPDPTRLTSVFRKKNEDHWAAIAPWLLRVQPADHGTHDAQDGDVGSGADRILLKRERMKVHGSALNTSQPAFRWTLVRGRDHHSVLALVLPLQTQLP
jgi:hypothetical protein